MKYYIKILLFNIYKQNVLYIIICPFLSTKKWTIFWLLLFLFCIFGTHLFFRFIYTYIRMSNQRAGKHTIILTQYTPSFQVFICILYSTLHTLDKMFVFQRQDRIWTFPVSVLEWML